MSNGLALERPSDFHLMRFEPEGHDILGEFIAYDFVDWAAFLHCGRGRDLSERFGLERSLTIS